MKEFLAQLPPYTWTLLAAAAALLTVLWVAKAYMVKDRLRGRLKSIEERRKALYSDLTSGKKRRDTSKIDSLSLMRQTVDYLKLMRSQQAEKISVKLMRAGWRGRDALVIYLFARAVLPIAVALLALNFLYVIGIGEMTSAKKMLYAISAILLGNYAPDLYVKNMADRRRQQLREGLPDALDLLVICAEAGLSLDAALNRVAREMAHANPILAEEIGLTAVELGFLPNRAQALDNLTLRTDLPSIRALVGTLGQTEKYGTPLAQSLRILAAEFRNDRLMKAEEKAAKLPVILTLPMVTFILPPLFIVLIGPGILRIIDSFSKMM